MAKNTFMDLQTTDKATLCSVDCSKCGQAIYSHEFSTEEEFSDETTAAQYLCPECGGTSDPKTFANLGEQYACRYSAPGYMDCTPWSYGKNVRKLQQEVRELFG